MRIPRVRKVLRGEGICGVLEKGKSKVKAVYRWVLDEQPCMEALRPAYASRAWESPTTKKERPTPLAGD